MYNIGMTTDRLTRKQSKAVYEFLRNGGNIVDAYLSAGYRNGVKVDKDEEPVLYRRVAINAGGVFRSAKVKAAIEEAQTRRVEHHEDREAYTVDFVRAEFLRLARKNESLGNLGETRQCLENIAKTIGAFKEVSQVDLQVQREYSETEKVEAKRLARLLVGDGTLESNNVMLTDTTLPAGQPVQPAKDNASQGILEGQEPAGESKDQANSMESQGDYSKDCHLPVNLDNPSDTQSAYNITTRADYRRAEREQGRTVDNEQTSTIDSTIDSLQAQIPNDSSPIPNKPTLSDSFAEALDTDMDDVSYSKLTLCESMT